VKVAGKVVVDAGDRLATFQLDITDRTAVEALPGRVEAVLGAPDGIVNVDVNLYGTIHMVRRSCPVCCNGRSPTSPTCRAWAASCRSPARPSTAPARRP
jgi:hypothetical protein